ncbi:MAG: gliding motility-associated C-terminal domain-containing protein, partial [Tannerella sp.]|nr:gliding motility-associated C-terminal domain-containing protein [Tannerella sp.]
MKRAIVQIFFFFASFPLWAQYIVVGGNGSPLVAENKNRIAVYLLNGLTGAEISYTSSEEEAHQWYRYDKKTIDAVPIPCSQSGKTSTITGIEDGYGYFVTPSSGLPYYAWIIDYSKYLPVI